MLASKDTSLIFIHHPEFCFIKFEILNNFFFLLFSDVVFSILELIESESFILPIMLFPQFLILTFFVLILVSFYFSYFSTATKEETTIDSDFLIASSLTESEKEIGSLDDIILGLVVLIYILVDTFIYIVEQLLVFSQKS
jgi:hypothetical protein